MKQLILIVSMLCYCNCQEAVVKCCADDEGLIKYIFRESPEFQYGCVSTMSNDSFNEITHGSLTLGKTDLKMIHRLPQNCTSERFIEVPLATLRGRPTTYCFDRIIAQQTEVEPIVSGDGTIVVLTCDNAVYKHDPDFLTLGTVAKCCPEDMIYDVENHSCVTDLNNRGLFKEFISRNYTLLDIQSKGPRCVSPDIMYEYNNDVFTFELVNDKLRVQGAGRNHEFKKGTFCLDDTLQGKIIARNCRGSCDDGPCVTKCCPEGHFFGYKNCSTPPSCIPSYIGLNLDFYDVSDISSPKHVPPPDVIGFKYTKSECNNGIYRLDPNSEDDAHYLDEITGHLIVPMLPKAHQHRYCLEMVDRRCRNETPEFYTFICFPEATNNEKLNLKLYHFSYALIVSCVFLALTLLVYIILPQLRNLHGKTLMCHVSAMLVMYCCLVRVQMVTMPQDYCTVFGYIIHFSSLSAFAWLNVMCFDIWWTFGNIRSMQMQGSREIKKFLQYSAYAWGYPLLLTTTTYLVDVYDVLPGWLDPNIGESQCWFSSSTTKYPYLFLFILPLSVQIGSNLVFFILTAIHCSKVKSEIHRMQAGSVGERSKRRFLTDKSVYSMNIKLFLVMGITWIMEILSFIFSDPMELWYATDLINALQGLPIFCILVLKKKVFRLMKKRFGIGSATQRSKSDATTTTGITNSTIEPHARKNLTVNMLSAGSRISNVALLPKSP